LLADLQAALSAAAGDPSVAPAEIAGWRAAVAEALLDPQAAAVEFTHRLVLVTRESGETLPFESHHLERTSPGEATEQLLRRLAGWGYGAVLVDSAPPDHLGAELRLMSVLCHDERAAWQRNAPEAARDSLARQDELLSAHLLRWAPDYCAALATRTEHSYLKAMAGLTASTLTADAAALAEICEAAGVAAAKTVTG
jgi:TorA maturation chaperone TorD